MNKIQADINVKWIWQRYKQMLCWLV